MKPPFKFPMGQQPNQLAQILAMLGGGDEPKTPMPQTPPMDALGSGSPLMEALKGAPKNPVEAFAGIGGKPPQAPLGSAMPTTQLMGEKKIPSAPFSMPSLNPLSTGNLEALLGKEQFAEEGSLLGDASEATSGMTGNPLDMLFPKIQQQGPQKDGVLSAMDQAKKAMGPEVNSDSPGFTGPLPPDEPEPVQMGYPGQEHDLIQSAAQEMAQGGVDSHEKADQALRNEFQDDPYIEDAIREARSRYEDARQRSQTGPGVMEYIGYVLATLAGANPMQAAEAVSRRGEKRQDEHMALEQLLGAQGMKIQDRRMQKQLGAQQQSQALKMLMDQQGDAQKAAVRAGERSDDRNYQNLTNGLSDARQRLNMLMQKTQLQKPNPQEQAEIDQLKERIRFFNRQLGRPEQNEQGKPMGMLDFDPDVSRSAARMLGLG